MSDHAFANSNSVDLTAELARSPDGGIGHRDSANFSPGAAHVGVGADSHGADSAAIVDAHLLFHAEFKRTGHDLRLIGSDGQIHVVPRHFESEHPRALTTPAGGRLNGDVVAALAGPAYPGQYATADMPQGATPVIGHAARIDGTVSVVRNGVAVTLNNGDVLLKGDVVQTAGDGSAGLVFNDGSAFRIGHDSRLVLSEFSYDPHGTANLEAFDLVQGSFSFASGNIAHSGDMRIGTPVASARILGSAGGGEIGANDGAVTLSIFHQGDGLHQATAFDRDGSPIATISSDGGRWMLTQNGASQLIVDEQTKTDADMAAEFDALTDILKLKGSGSVTPGALGVRGSSSPPSDFHDLGFGSLGFKPDGLFGHNPLDNFLPFDGLFHPGNDGVVGLPVSPALLFIDPPPLISSGATADVNEGVAAHTAVYKATAADAIRATISYSLVLGLHDDASAFSIDASTGVVTINATPDFETQPSYHFTVEASDPFGVSSTRAVTLAIDDLPPVIRSGATAAVNEAVAAHSVAYTAVAADTAGGAVTFSLVSGLHDDAAAFRIDASTGVVTLNNVPDFETKSSYDFTVKASDASGDFTTQAVTLSINDLPPVISSSAVATAIDEAVAAHTAVYTAVAADPAGGTVTYSLVAGLNDDAAFSIDASTGVVTINNVPDFETKPSYDFTVKASDPSGHFTTQTVTLAINDLPPVINSATTADVDEAVAAHGTVYTAIAADPAGGTVAYSLVSGLNDDAAAFHIDASTGVVTIDNVPDFETKPSYTFTVEASDPSGKLTTEAVTLSINDLPPVISSGAHADVDEAVVAHTVVYTAIAADPAGGTVTYALVSGLNDDAAAFHIDASTGVVTLNNVPDFETKPSYDFTVKASDPSGDFTTKAVTLSINDLPPVISSSAVATAIDEATAAHTVVYTAVAADPAGGTVTYSLATGLNDDAAAFSIDPSSGVVIINNVPDFETKPSYAFTVEASDPSGDFTTQAVTLSINDLPPVISSGALATTIDEGSAAGTPVYTAVAADPAGGTVTYSLANGLNDDATAFTIDPATGVVTINNVPDFETQPSYTFMVEATDPSGKSTMEAVTLSINDLPPVISSGAVATAIDEGSAAGTPVYTAIAADPVGGTVTYSLATGLNDDAAAFHIDASTGVVTLDNVPDFETKLSYSFTVKASDPSGDFTTKAVILAINDLPPVISSGAVATAIDEATAAHTAVYTAVAADPAGGTVTYSLATGLNDDASAFSIDRSSGVVTINNVPDFETKPSYAFTVEATDPSGKSTTEAVTLSIIDLPPVIGSGASATTIDEGSAAGTAVYTAIAADPAGGTVTWSLASGLNDDAAAFTIDPATGVVTINNVPDFETQPSYTFTVEATDPSGKSTMEAVTLSINDLPPVISSGAVATAIDEGSAAGMPVYTAIAADPGGTVTYTLVSGLNDDDAAFHIDASTGIVTINSIPDYETRSSYSFTVQASDASGHAATQIVTLAINDLPPVISSAATADINEGVAVGTPVYTAVAADPAGGTVTWSLVPGLNDDAATFSIDANGVVKINAIPDFETKTSYSFTVAASDASSHAVTQTVTLSVNDLAPVISSGAVATGINDGAAAHTAVYTAAAADPGGGVVRYALGSGLDSAAFSIDASSGIVTLDGVPNFQTQSSYSFTVEAIDASGALSTETVTLAVNGLPPVVSGDLAISLYQGASVALTTADLTAVSVDGGAPTFHVTGSVHGYVALASAPATAITSFTEAQLAAGSVLFVSDGTASAAASFTVAAADGTSTRTSTPVTIDATVSGDLVLPGDINVLGHTESIHSLTQSGGTLSGTGVLTDSGTASFTGGTENGNGKTIVDGAATLFSAGNQTFTLDGRTLELAGSGLVGAFAGDTLHLDNGAVFNIDAGVAFTDASTGGTFNIASGAGTGSLTVAGSYLKTGSGTTHIAEGVSNSGIIDDQSGTLDIGGSVTNNDALKVEGGGSLVLEGAVTGTGIVLVGNNGSVEFGSSVSVGQTVSFSAAPGTVKIDNASSFAGTITNFSASTDTIDLVGYNPNTINYSISNGLLRISDNSHSPITIHVSGPDYGFDAEPDSAGTGVNLHPSAMFLVHNATELNNALLAVSVGGWAVGNPHNTIQFANNISLGHFGTDLSAINLASGSALAINGAGFTLNGAGLYRGLFAFGGTVAIDDLNIVNTLAQGGAGGTAAGGGGAGLGGGLFVAASASVTVTNVNFSGDSAIGGGGGSADNLLAGGHHIAGGGGGMGTNGVDNDGSTTRHLNSYHQYNSTATADITDGTAGGTLGVNVPGHPGYAQAAQGSTWLGGGKTHDSAAGYGGFGQGGGSGLYAEEIYIGGGTNLYTFALTPGGKGGFGGGGGGGSQGQRGNLNSIAGAGGFGGGGGGGHTGGAGGYGAGIGGSYGDGGPRYGPGGYRKDGGGGGGLGAGGAIFVQDGGHLTVGGGSLSGGTVAGGTGGFRAGDGLGLGAGIFIQGNNTLSFAPVIGDSLVISDVIADQNNNGGTGNVDIAGGGAVHFAAFNTYQGTTLIEAGATLDLDVDGRVGAQAVTDNGVLNLNTATTIGSAVTDGGTLNVNAATIFASTVTNNGMLNIGAVTTFAGTVTNNGTLTFESGGAGIGAGTIIDNGTLKFGAPGTIANAITDHGTIVIGADGTFEFQVAITGTGTFNFSQGHAITAVFDTGTPTFTIKGFDVGDTIDLRSIAATAYTIDANNVMTLKNVGGATVATLHFDAAQHFDNGFGVVADGNGGSDLRLVQTDFTVDNAAELDAALTAVSQGGTSYASGFNYTIHFAAGISLGSLASNLAAINLASGSTLLIDGAGFTVDGAGTHRGFFDNAGSVTIQNLTIANMLAQGGAGGNGSSGGGGGGAGLGGGVFVAAGAAATIDNVVFTHDTAHGGAGGGISGPINDFNAGGGGGGIGSDGASGSGEQRTADFTRVYAGGAGGGTGIANLPSGTDSGGNGGSAYYHYFTNGYFKYANPGGQGGFGGGGGGGAGILASHSYGGSRYHLRGGNGGFGGGGGGGGLYNTHSSGGFGGGTGGTFGEYSIGVGLGENAGGDGGGGLGAGGGIFVQQGGSLTIADGSLSGGSVAGGAAGPNFTTRPIASAGLGLGSGIFIQGNDGITLAASSGQTLTVSDVIADQGGNGGLGTVEIKGPGIVEFDAANTYAGGTAIDVGATLLLGAAGSVGTGAVTDNGTLHLTGPTTLAGPIIDNGAIVADGEGVFVFNGAVSGSGSITIGSGLTTLKFNSAVPTSEIHGFGIGDAIDLVTVTATGFNPYANGVLTLTGAGGAPVATLHFDPAQQDLISTGFRLAADGSGGTYVFFNAIQTVFEVSSLDEYVAALRSINAGGPNSINNTAYTINLHANLALTALLPAIDLLSGDSLAIHGLGHTIDGAVNGVPTYSGLYLRSGSLALSDLTIANTLQRGGDGASDRNAYYSGGGGGGLGAGGGLVVGAGASATLDNVGFVGDQALGGRGSNSYSSRYIPGQPSDNGRNYGGLFEGRYNQGFGVGGTGGNTNHFNPGTNGGFGGGGGGASESPFRYHSVPGGAGGYGAGNGAVGYFFSGGGGGGGAGLGGGIFVMAGGSLTIGSGSFSGNGALGNGGGGAGGYGLGLGGALFNNGSEIVFSPDAATTLTIGDSSIGAGISIAGSGIIDITGAGDVIVSGAALSGSQTINITGSGDVTLGAITGSEIINVAGSGDVILSGPVNGTEQISFSGTGTLTLPIETIATTGDLANAINHIDIGGILSVAGVHYHEFDLTADIAVAGFSPLNLAAGDTLTVKTAGHAFDGATNGAGSGFVFAPPASGGIASLTGSPVPTFSIGSASDLTAAIDAIDVGGLFSAANLHYVFNMTGDVPPTVLPTIDLAAGDTLTVNAAGHAFDDATGTFTFTAPAGGGTGVFSSASDVTLAVTSESDLQATLGLIDSGGLFSATNTSYVINMRGDVPLTAGLPAVALAAGDTLTVNLAGHAFDGATSAGNTFIFSAPAGGGSTTLIDDPVPTFAVATASDLTAALNEIDVGGEFSSPHTDYVINLTGDVPLTAGLPAVALAAGDTLTVNLAGHAFDGATSPGNTFIFSAPTGGGSTTLIDDPVPTFSVGTASAFADVIGAIDVHGYLSFVNTDYVINLTGDVPLTDGLPAVALAAGDTLTVNLAGHGFDGATSAGGSFIFSTPAGGGSTTLIDDPVPTFSVGTASALASVLGAIDVGGYFSSVNTHYVINLTGDVPLTAGLPAVTLAAGDTLTVNRAGHAFDGATSPGNTFVFSAPTGGGSTTLIGNPVPTFAVATASDLIAALNEIDVGGEFSSPHTDYVINMTGDALLASGLPAVNLAAGDTLTINGAGHTIDGGNTHTGLYLQSGTVAISNLTIEGTYERGGAGGNSHYAGGGGGGVGAGGGLFVGSGATAVLDHVTVTGDTAIGGSGGSNHNTQENASAGGGGALDGRSPYGFGSGGAGGRVGSSKYGAHGGLGGGGGGSIGYSYAFHGGTRGGSGGYGAAGGANAYLGSFGFYAGGGGGGGGAGLGGGVFVAPGGSLTIEGGSISGNSVAGGNGGNGAGPGQGIGEGLFTYSQTVNLAPAQGETLTISDPIAGGGGGRIHIAGPGSVVLSGPITGTTIDISSTGTVSLPATDFVNDSFAVSGAAHFTLANTISGGGTVSASGSAVLSIIGNNSLTGGMVLDGTSTIDLASANAAGSGIISFVPNAGATLLIEAGDTPSNQIHGFNPGDIVKLAGFAAGARVTIGAGNVLTVADSLHSVDLHLDPGADFSLFQFDITPYSGGVMLTDRVPFAITAVVGQPFFGSGVELRGTAAPDVTISIIANGGTTVLGTTIADDNGNFDLVTSPLADGIYSFQAIAQAGGSTLTTAGFSVNVLPGAPDITTQVTNNPLNGDTVELQGTGEANQQILLYLDGSSTALTTAPTMTGADGKFDIVTPALVDGPHTVRVTETDTFGFTSALSAGFAVNVNPTAPTITAVVGQPFNGGPIEVTGTGEANRFIEIFADGSSTMLGYGTTDGSGKFDFSVAGVTDGVHTLTAETFDPPNLFSTASNIVPFNVNPSAPAITTLVAQPVNGGTIHVKGIGEPGLAFTLYADGGTTPVGSGTIGTDGHFDITTTMIFADGVHYLTATATNSLNFTSPVSSHFPVNVLPATPVIESVVAVAGTTQQIEVQGTAEAGQLINLFADGTTYLASAYANNQFGHFDIFASILGGAHAITATETDTANVVSAVSIGVSVNVTPTAPAITTLVGQPVDGDKVSVTGTAQHPGGSITLYADGGSTAVGSGSIAGDGSFAFTTTATFADGIHTFTAVETDNGIDSAASVPFTVDVDPSAPSNLAQVGTAFQGDAVVVTGTGEVGDSVILSAGGATVGTGVVDQTGHFGISIAGLSAGIQSVSAMETDADHLSSTASQVNVTVISAPPLLASAISVDDPNGQVEVSGTGVAGALITLYADGGATVIGSGVADQTGHFAVYSSNGIALGGPHDFTATQTVTTGLGSVTSLVSAPIHADVVTVADRWTIASAGDLANAIAAIDLTGASSQPNTHYIFNIVGNLQLNAQLPAFNLAPGASVTIEGNGDTLDANGLPGLFVYSGSIAIDDLAIVNATAKGGANLSGGGGGGAGLGGGLFIASGGAVQLDNVSFAQDQAVGGDGSFFDQAFFGGSGGGGLGGNGTFNGGGGIGLGATGGNSYGSAAGQGIIPGTASGGGSEGQYQAPRGAQKVGNGGGIGGTAGTAASGGDGGFGGGGAGGARAIFGRSYHGGHGAGGDGGFGGGGGGSAQGAGGAGGFGGGGGASSEYAAGGGGFGAGWGARELSGGGLGAGGAIFVQEGGQLTFGGSGGAHDNSVTGGTGRYITGSLAGSALGSGLFLQGNESVTFAPDATHTVTIGDVIADMTGSNDHSRQIGAGALVLDGAGTLVLSGNNTFTGGITLESGTLDLVGAHGAGSGAITLVNAAQATLMIDAAGGDLPNAIVIDNFQATSETFGNGVLTLSNATGSVNIDVANAGQNFGADLTYTIDSANGTTTISGVEASWTNVQGGDWSTSAANWGSIVPAAANDATMAPGTSTAAYTVSIAAGELAAAHNFAIDDANATLDDQGILMLSGALTLAAGTFHLDGGGLQTALSMSVANGATFEGDGMVSVGGTVSGTVIASGAGGPALDFISAVTGNVNFHINAGATLEFDSSVAGDTTVTFDGSTGELKLDAPGSFAATIVGFNGGAPNAAHSDVIDLAGIDGNHLTQSSYDQNSGVLTVSDGAHVAELTFSKLGGVSFASDGQGGTLIYEVTPVTPGIDTVLSAPDPAGRVEVKGTGDAGSTITLYADNATTAIATGTVDSTGHFDVYSPIESLTGGPHSITASETVQGSPSLPSTAANVTVVPVANTFTITSGADLATAIADIDLGGVNAAANTHYIFNVVGNLQLGAQLPAFNLAAGTSVTIEGNGDTLDAHGLPGLFVYSGAVEIDDLAIVNATAKGGGSRYGGGGGGAGLGGGLFIASGGAVLLDNVSFAQDRAVGGSGNFLIQAFSGGGGGGGLGGNGYLNGGGGIGLGATGGSGFGNAPGQGIIPGTASGGGSADEQFNTFGPFNNSGPPLLVGNGGGIGGTAGTVASGGAGGFGGGGGGGGYVSGDYSYHVAGGHGGFGGGGGGSAEGAGGAGGFGGGGGSSYYGNAAGGFGAGSGTRFLSGGGLGAGGAIFVQEGGQLTFGGSGGAHGNSVASGAGFYANSGVDGSALGSGLFLQGNESVTFAPDSAHTITISDVIADMTGSRDASGQTGAGHLVLDGQGTLTLSATNTFTGGVTIENGTLDLAGMSAAGTGAILFSPADHGALEFSVANAPANEIDNFGTRDQIVIDGFHANTESYSNGMLVLNGDAGSVSLDVSGPNLHDLSDFRFVFDSVAGTTTITGGPDLSGNDVIHAGAGAHILTGGTGDDVFFFRAADFSAGVTNTISDLASATGSGEHDRIHLEGVDPASVSVVPASGGHDADIRIPVAGGTADILVQGGGSSPVTIEFQNTTPTSDANLNTLLTPSTANETIGTYYLGANPPSTSSLVSYGADGSVIDRDVTNTDGSHTITVQGANAVLTASGASDTFVFQFAPQTAAAATINQFDVVHDVLQLSHAVYADAATALAAIIADPSNAGNPANTSVALDPLHAVTLAGVTPDQLTQHAFLLV